MGRGLRLSGRCKDMGHLKGENGWLVSITVDCGCLTQPGLRNAKFVSMVIARWRLMQVEQPSRPG